MREAETLESHQSTGRYEEAPPPSHRAGRLAAVVGGAALVAFAARDRSWRSLGLALAGAPLVYRGATGHWPMRQARDERLAELEPTLLETSVTVNRPRREVYDFWHKLENLPRFMRHLESVEERGDGISHWVAKSPVGLRAEWDAEIVEDTEGEILAWRSLSGSQVHNTGSVLFEDAPGGRGTVVRVAMELSPAGNGLGRALGRMLLPITSQQVHEDLRRFKSLIEAGEIPTTQGQPVGQRSAINPRNPL